MPRTQKTKPPTKMPIPKSSGRKAPKNPPTAGNKNHRLKKKDESLIFIEALRFRGFGQVTLQELNILFFHRQKMKTTAGLIGPNHLSESRDHAVLFGDRNIQTEDASDIQDLISDDIEPAQAHIHRLSGLFLLPALEDRLDLFL